MGKRSRKAGRLDRPAPPPGAERARAAGPADAFRTRAEKSEAKNAEVRATLTQLEPGEYPLPLKLAIGTCIVLVAINAAMAIGGYELEEGEGTAYVQLALFSGVILMAVWGMWKHRYWAVLGFQALLALTIVIASLALITASNLWAVVLCASVIAYGSWLFWKMIRVMARIQMPEARRRPPG